MRKMMMFALFLILITTICNAASNEPAGRFSVYDYKAKREVPLAEEKSSSNDTIFLKGDRIECKATLTHKAGRTLVDGTLTNLADDDRALILSYTIPPLSQGSKYWFTPNEGVSEGSGSVYPIAAMCGIDKGIALAIPPTSPFLFQLTGSEVGLCLRMYLGLAKETTQFPKSARFSFIIYPCDSKWGFRDALSRYYHFYPEYYTHHDKPSGLWMFCSEKALPLNVSYFSYDEAAMVHNFGDIVERDKKAGIITFPYFIVGQREIKHLPALPKSYEESMDVFDKWTRPNPKTIPATKENLCTALDLRLKDEIESSALKGPDGKFSINIRNTAWGDNSVTFVTNPNPDLFAGQKKATVGSETITRALKWLTTYPDIGGIYIDSLGSTWLGKLNSRRDHFPYARYPLTFDPDGNVSLHNALSHYEFLETLRSDLHSRKKLLFGNGVYMYRSKDAEYGDIKESSRFFQAALLDVAGSEMGAPGNLERFEFGRVCMGPKPYLTLNYKWTDRSAVESYLNQALLYDVFATNADMQKSSYYKNPNGHKVYKEMYDWLVPLLSALSKAGWQPVTYASSRIDGVKVERYGEGLDVYFTIYNPGPERDCAVEIEINKLGMGVNPRIEQISGPGFISAEKTPAGILVHTKLATERTAVLHVSK